MNFVLLYSLRLLRKIFHERNDKSPYGWVIRDYCDYCDQNGNDEIYHVLENYKGGGLMFSKWGTVEFSQANSNYVNKINLSLKDCWAIIRGRMGLPYKGINYALYNNAGVFPLNKNIQLKFGDKALQDCQLIDVLGSYIREEKGISSLWSKALKVNLDAFYAPWMFKNPWTKWLKGKRVLVVHPFVESIESQYKNNRTRLFEQQDALPEFKELILVKAVQSQAGEQPPFEDWFEALAYMEREIDKHDYDVAIIGCGAYGMSLAAHVKKQGKVGIHLGGWVQMLFGVYGERWISQQTKYAKYVNKYWIRPNDNEQIKRGNSIEGGCYW